MLPLLLANTRIPVPQVPPLKHLLRLMEKMALNSWSAERICDVVRCVIVCSTMAEHVMVLKQGAARETACEWLVGHPLEFRRQG